MRADRTFGLGFAALISFGSGLLLAAAAPADNHYKMMEIYTHVASAAFFAEKNCPGVKANRTTLVVIRAAAKIADAEESMIDESIKGIAAEIRAQFEKSGRLAWCSDTYDALGPSGRLVKGVIAR